MNKDELIDAIVQIEWPMFAGVNNEGGKAACQMDLATFRIMRISQYSAWGEELLESCLADLRAAQNQGRNLMTEKYARMMKTTFPDEYPAIEKSLPPLDPAAARQIEDIVACHVQWKTALDQKYPHLGDRSRPVRTQEDRAGLPSVETYTRAELQTCSPRTISLYHSATMKRAERGENEAEENLLNQVRQYGFASLEDAEQGYYMMLMYTEPKILVVNATGGSWQLEGKNISPANVFLSDDGTMVGYYETDTLTGATILNVAKLGAEPSLTMENVEVADFLGTTNEVGYFKDYENGLGTMGVWDGGDPTEVEGVGGVHFAVDQNAVYYINNIDQENGNGDLHVMANGEDTLIDTGVYSMQYKYNGKLAYLKNYDYTANRGDLYYYDGNESKEIDTGITAIFMY